MNPVVTAPILFDVVYRRLMDAIIDCTLLPGQRIVQLELATRLGVSRAPVSHALQVLKHQGLLQDTGKKGLEVASIDPGRVRDFYQVRATLDGFAARMAGERAAAGQLAKQDADHLRRVFAAGLNLGDETAMSRRVQADIDFHRAVYRASGNGAIAEVMDPLWPHIQRAMVLVLEANKLRKQAWRDHRLIMTSILAGDPTLADKTAFSHAVNAGNDTEARLRKSGV